MIGASADGVSLNAEAEANVGADAGAGNEPPPDSGDQEPPSPNQGDQNESTASASVTVENESGPFLSLQVSDESVAVDVVDVVRLAIRTVAEQVGLASPESDEPGNPGSVNPDPQSPAIERAVPTALLASEGNPSASVVMALVGMLAATAAASGAWTNWVPARPMVGRCLAWLGGFGFFSRLSRSHILDHARRRDIHDYVQAHPGERVEVVRRALRIPNGAMRHHLQLLDAHNVVRVRREGSMTRLYPAGPRVEAREYVPQNRRGLLAAIAQSPGCTQAELARGMGWSKRVMSYHVVQMERAGLVRVERRGRSNHCYVACGVTIE